MFIFYQYNVPKLSDSFNCNRIESIVGESNTRHSVTVSRQNLACFDQVLDTRWETIFFVINISFHRSQEFSMYLISKTVLLKGNGICSYRSGSKKLQIENLKISEKRTLNCYVLKIFRIFYVFFLDPDCRVLFILGCNDFLAFLPDFILIFKV